MTDEGNHDLFDVGLLRSAKKAEFFQGDIIALSKLLPESDEELVALLEEQSRLLEAEIFSNLWIAALWGGRKIPGRLLKEGAQFFPDIGYLLATTNLCVGVEETSEALLEAVESGQLGSERELVALICAARRIEQAHEGELEDLEFPDRLLFLARKKARTHERLLFDDFEMMQELLLSVLSKLLRDENLRRVLEDHEIDFSKVDKEFEKRFYQGFRSLEKFVPNERPERVISGYQVRRAVPKVSRNAACPCGSGKKYKKCCFANDQKKLSQSSEVAGLTLDELEDEREAHLTPESVRGMRLYELKRLDPAKLSENVLWPIASRLMVFDELDHVLTLRENTRFKELPIWEVAFEDLLCQAIKKKRRDLIERVLEEFPGLEDACQTELAIMRSRERPVEFLEVMESRCRELLLAEDKEREESGISEGSRQLRVEWTELGFNLLDGGFPHMGIAIARGWLPIINEFETDYYLEAIEEKRDELGLNPFDVSEELASIAEGIGEARRSREKKYKIDQQVAEDLKSRRAAVEAREKELDQLRKELSRIKQNADRTEADAAKRIAELERERVRAQGSGKANPELEAEIAELRGNMRRLKDEVKRKHEQRNELRRDLRKVRSQMSAQEGTEGKKTNESQDAEDENEERMLIQFDQEGESAQPVRIPVFPGDFLKKKRDFPGFVTQAAMQLAGRLSSGEPAAFQGVKRLKLRRGILRQKVAGSYRLLFSIEKDELRIVDLINRRDLEKWLSE